MPEKNDEFLRRNYTFKIRAEKDESGGDIIAGRPIVYDSKTDIGGMFAEIIERGALDKTDLTDVRFLVNHNEYMIPLARCREGVKESTMTISTDRDGMGISVNLDTENNTEARNLYSAVQRGDITGMSFMFGIRDEEWEDIDTDYPTRHIKDISAVLEVSAVTFPAYESTSISARDKRALESAREALDGAKGNTAEAEKRALELEKLKAEYLYKL